MPSCGCALNASPCVPVSAALTDVVVAMSFLEFLAQGERCEALELLRQLLWTMPGAGLVAPPADLVFGLGLAYCILLVIHQIQCIPLHGSVCHRVILIMGTDNVQVVIQSHMYCVVLIPEPRYAQKTTKQVVTKRPGQSLESPAVYMTPPLSH